MPDRASLPFILDLLDDDSPVVRAEISRALQAYGEALPGLLAAENRSLSQESRETIRRLLAPARKKVLQREWKNWNATQSGKFKLERGLDLISRYMSFPFRNSTLSHALDGLASQARETGSASNERALAIFLFSTLGFEGNQTHYYDPANSDLHAVIDTRSGLPITLACVLILVGHRLGLHIEGSHVPGHFLASVTTETGNLYVDCFNKGRWFHEQALREPPFSLTDDAIQLAHMPADAESIMARILRNLIVAYTRQDDVETQQFIATLLGELQEHQPHRTLMDASFTPGDLVRAQDGQYRGVVVQADPICQADDTWYYTNRTQPDRNQPWYHILVDGSSSSTYVAQSELQSDPKGQSISHPLISYFFDTFTNGRYTRNERPWTTE